MESFKPHAFIPSVILPLRCALCRMTRSGRVFTDNKWADIHTDGSVPAPRAERMRAAIDALLPEFTDEDLKFLREIETMPEHKLLRRLL